MPPNFGFFGLMARLKGKKNKRASMEPPAMPPPSGPSHPRYAPAENLPPIMPRKAHVTGGRQHPKSDNEEIKSIQREIRKFSHKEMVGDHAFYSIKIDENLRNFLWRVFKNKDIMEGGGRIVDSIYFLYNTTGIISNCQYAVAKEVVFKVWQQVEKHTLFNQAFFYNREKDKIIPLQDVVRWLNETTLDVEYWSDFIFFQLNENQVTYRLYMNAKRDELHRVTAAITKYIDENSTAEHGIQSFKLASPLNMERRKDTVVCYCKDRAAAERLAQHVSGLNGAFHADIPAMTSRVGHGLAVGAEPISKAYHVSDEIKPMPTDATSFGMFRSRLIADAVLKYKAYTTQGGLRAGFLTFTQLVAVAFKANGMSVETPGDNGPPPRRRKKKRNG